MSASAAIADSEIRTHCGIFSSRQEHSKGARLRKRGDDAPDGRRARSSDPQRTVGAWRHSLWRLSLSDEQRDRHRHRRRSQSPRPRAQVSRRGSAISSLDWARDPEQVEGRRTVM